MIIQAAVTSSDFKKNYANITKNHLEFLVTPTSITTDAMALQFLQVLSSYYKANHLKDVQIGLKLTGRIVNNHLSSCSMRRFKIVANDHF